MYGKLVPGTRELEPSARPWPWALAVLILVLLGSGPIAGETGPHWLRSDELIRVDHDLDSGAALIGRSFVLVPYVSEALAPRYDYRVLLTFGREQVEERQAFGKSSYAVAYGDGVFSLKGMVMGQVSPQAAALLSQIGLHRDPSFVIAVDEDDHAFLVKDSAGRAADFPVAFGRLRELTAEEAKRLEAHFAAVEKSEREKRAADLQAAAGGPLPVLDVYRYRGGELIWNIYYGLFDRLSDPRLEGTSRQLVRDALVSNLFQTYHHTYSQHYGDKIREPTFLVRSDLVERDDAGNELSRLEGQTFRIRTRYKESYERSFPDVARTFGSLFSAFDSAENRVRTERLFDAAGACERFLTDYGSLSPGTIARFEENLERAVLGRQPIVLAPPRAAIIQAPYKLPWELGPNGGPAREVLAQYGVSWAVPSDWERIQRAYGIAVYNTGTTNVAQVIVRRETETVEDPLVYVNSWRDKEDLPPVTSLGEQPVRTLEIQGRKGILASFPGSTQALIHDGPQTWSVTMYGSKQSVAARNDELMAFVESFQWEGAPRIEKTADVATERETAATEESGTGRRRRPGPLSMPVAPAEAVDQAPVQAAKPTDELAGTRLEADEDEADAPLVDTTAPPEPQPEEARGEAAADLLEVASEIHFDVEPREAFLLFRSSGDERFTLIGKASEYGSESSGRSFTMPSEGFCELWIRAEGWQDRRLRLKVVPGGQARVSIRLSR